MENAAKALQMAAGVLISVLVLGLIVYSYNNLSSTKRVEQDVIREEQAVNFNKSFEGYNKEKLTGSEMISLANKVEDYNDRYPESEGYTKIELTVYNISTARYPIYYSRANNDPNTLAGIHKSLQDYIRNTGNSVKTSYGGRNYTYKELYSMYKQGSNASSLAMILGKSSEQEAKNEVRNWVYSLRIKGMEDFLRENFTREQWNYDNNGRISVIRFKMN